MVACATELRRECAPRRTLLSQRKRLTAKEKRFAASLLIFQIVFDQSDI